MYDSKTAHTALYHSVTSRVSVLCKPAFPGGRHSTTLFIESEHETKYVLVQGFGSIAE